MGDIPGNSHFKAGMLVSMLSDSQANSQEWASNNLGTYVLLKPNANYKNVNDKFPALVLKYVGPEIQRFLNISFEEFLSKGNKYGYSLQKLIDIHLDTSNAHCPVPDRVRNYVIYLYPGCIDHH
jgi:putative ABC transport system permease protein